MNVYEHDVYKNRRLTSSQPGAITLFSTASCSLTHLSKLGIVAFQQQKAVNTSEVFSGTGTCTSEANKVVAS